MQITERVKWVDVVRCIGIFLIYLAHFAEDAGMVYPYAYTHHVALFFLISGGMENMHLDCGIWDTILKTVKKILIPWLFYAVLSTLLCLIKDNYYPSMIPAVKTIAMGTIRDRFFAKSLWFLTCMAVVRILFAVIRKLRYKTLILLVCFVLYYIADVVMIPHPIETPSLLFNLDSALYYIVFYAIGYAAFPYVCNALNANTVLWNWIRSVSTLICGGYAAALFVGKDLLSYLPQVPFVELLRPILCTLLVAWFYCAIAKQLENIEIMNVVGRNTLHLCGNEYIVKTGFLAFLYAFGLNTEWRNPLVAYLYTAVLLVVAVKFIIPQEMKMLDKIYGLLPKAFV